MAIFSFNLARTLLVRPNSFDFKSSCFRFLLETILIMSRKKQAIFLIIKSGVHLSKKGHRNIIIAI